MSTDISRFVHSEACEHNPFASLINPGILSSFPTSAIRKKHRLYLSKLGIHVFIERVIRADIGTDAIELAIGIRSIVRYTPADHSILLWECRLLSNNFNCQT